MTSKFAAEKIKGFSWQKDLKFGTIFHNDVFYNLMRAFFEIQPTFDLMKREVRFQQREMQIFNTGLPWQLEK